MEGTKVLWLFPFCSHRWFRSEHVERGRAPNGFADPRKAIRDWHFSSCIFLFPPTSLSRQHPSRVFYFSFLWHAYVIPILDEVHVPIMIPVLGVPRIQIGPKINRSRATSHTVHFQTTFPLSAQSHHHRRTILFVQQAIRCCVSWLTSRMHFATISRTRISTGTRIKRRERRAARNR